MAAESVKHISITYKVAMVGVDVVVVVRDFKNGLLCKIDKFVNFDDSWLKFCMAARSE